MNDFDDNIFSSPVSSKELEDGFRGLVDAKHGVEDRFQYSLRPGKIDEFIGQDRVRENLKIAIGAATQRGSTLDHILFYGPPGLGKTTFASIIAGERGVSMKTSSGPVLERPGDLAAVLSSLQENDVLFIDEIHRLPRIVEEVLYPAMEDFFIDIIIGQGPAARSVKLDLKPFTLVAATTRMGLISSPLRDRFGLVERVEYYTTSQMVEIVLRSAELLEVRIDKDGAREIAGRSRGTPRIANRLLRRSRDYAEQRADGLVSKEVADKALNLLDIDSSGLDIMDRAVLRTIIDKFDGGPVGVDTIAASLSEDRGSIEEVYEPYLLQRGFLQRTPRGRMATAKAWQYFGLEMPEIAQLQMKREPHEFES